jgi:hypothetical protein
MSHVVIEVEACVPRTFMKNGVVRYTKKTYRTWVNLGRWPVLYRDRQIIVVKQFGSVCLYHADGTMELAGYTKTHPKAHLVPRSHGWWRIQPESLKALKRPSSGPRSP